MSGSLPKLHVIGTDSEQSLLILATRRNAKQGSYSLVVDDSLLEQIQAASGDGGEVTPPVPARVSVDSGLTPREIQMRLRSGRSVEDVAREAGVDPEWIERFAAPVRAEQAAAIDKAARAMMRAPRKGLSDRPLESSVLRNLAERGVVLVDDEWRQGWSARHLADGDWLVTFSYRNRGRARVAEWILDAAHGVVTSRNRLGTELGYLDQGGQQQDGGADREGPPPLSKPQRSKTSRAAKRAPAARKVPAAKRVPVAKRVPAAKKVPAASKEPVAGRVPAARKVPAAKRAPVSKTEAGLAKMAATQARTPPTGGRRRLSRLGSAGEIGTDGSRISQAKKTAAADAGRTAGAVTVPVSGPTPSARPARSGTKSAGIRPSPKRAAVVKAAGVAAGKAGGVGRTGRLAKAESGVKPAGTGSPAKVRSATSELTTPGGPVGVAAAKVTKRAKTTRSAQSPNGAGGAKPMAGAGRERRGDGGATPPPRIRLDSAGGKPASESAMSEQPAARPITGPFVGRPTPRALPTMPRPQADPGGAAPGDGGQPLRPDRPLRAVRFESNGRTAGRSPGDAD